MRMTPLVLIVGSVLVFWASTFVMVFLPLASMDESPSQIWRPMTPLELEGHDLWVRNGCHYCHSSFIRINDWGIGADRIAERGDYVAQQPAILGTERTGPDLSEEGGEHPDDWHMAHFINPRFTRPHSIMPDWQFLGEDNLRKLTARLQYQGMLAADRRVERQKLWHTPAVEAYARGSRENIRWLHAQIPEGWRPLPNPYPATDAALLRGKDIYQHFCLGCHGPVGDGEGPARPYLSPPPLNFTELRKNLQDGRYLGGILYYQIMNGITGTAMPYFKKDLESEKIWDVSNYVAVYFVGYTDANLPPRGIDASYEPPWKNPYPIPQTQPATASAPAPGEAAP